MNETAWTNAEIPSGQTTTQRLACRHPTELGEMMPRTINFYSLVMKSIRRRWYRNLALVMCFAFVTASLLSANFLIDGAQNSVQSGMQRLGADLLVVPEGYQAQTEAIIFTGKPSTFMFNQDVVGEVENTSGVGRVSPQVFVGSLSKAPCCSYAVELIGFDPQRDFTIQPWLQNHLARPLQTDEIIVGNLILADVGSRLQFYGHNFTVAGRLDATGMGIDTTVFMSLDDAYTMAEQSEQNAVVKLNLTRGQISAVLIKVADGADKNAVTRAITDHVPGTIAISSNYFAARVNEQLSAVTSTLYLTASSVTIVALPLVALISTMVSNERRKEMGLLRAMGGTRRFVFVLVLTEAAFLAVIGAVAGVAVSSVLMTSFQGVIQASLQIPFLWPEMSTVLGQVLLVCCLAVLIGALASLLPAYRASRMEPYEAIRRGEI